MSILESIADLFRPKVVVTSRRAMKNGNYDFMFFFCESGHPGGHHNVRWIARRGGTCFACQTSALDAVPEMKLLNLPTDDIEVRCADPNIWHSKYESQARDGTQYLIGMIANTKCQWRELWNPEAECKAVKCTEAIFDAVELGNLKMDG